MNSEYYEGFEQFSWAVNSLLKGACAFISSYIRELLM